MTDGTAIRAPAARRIHGMRSQCIISSWQMFPDGEGADWQRGKNMRNKINIVWHDLHARQTDKKVFAPEQPETANGSAGIRKIAIFVHFTVMCTIAWSFNARSPAWNSLFLLSLGFFVAAILTILFDEIRRAYSRSFLLDIQCESVTNAKQANDVSHTKIFSKGSWLNFTLFSARITYIRCCGEHIFTTKRKLWRGIMTRTAQRIHRCR